MTASLIAMFLGLGAIFGSGAAVMAYLITYNEWVHHFASKTEPHRMALDASIFTFVVFLIVSVAAGWYFAGIVS